MEKAAISEFFNYGAMGILALGFVAVLLLFWRADKRAALYAKALEETSFDRSKLIDVVSDNTKAITEMANQIGHFIRSQERQAEIMERFNSRLEHDRCPLLPDENKRVRT